MLKSLLFLSVTCCWPATKKKPIFHVKCSTQNSPLLLTLFGNEWVKHMTMIHLFFYQDLMYNKKNNSLDRRIDESWSYADSTRAIRRRWRRRVHNQSLTHSLEQFLVWCMWHRLQVHIHIASTLICLDLGLLEPCTTSSPSLCIELKFHTPEIAAILILHLFSCHYFYYQKIVWVTRNSGFV
jgi:hypothetical protein